MRILKEIWITLEKFFLKARVFALFHFRLKPRILKMKEFVKKIVDIKKDFFPIGKSLFVFSGRDDTLYFIVYKENALISVLEIYDEILNKIPERYQILPRISMNDMLVQA